MVIIGKRYQIKIYDENDIYKTTINPKDNKNVISFTNEINGGQGQTNLSFNFDFIDTTVENNDIVRIYEVDENNKSGRLIYSGVVNILDRLITNNYDEISLPMVGLNGLLSRIWYRNGGQTTFTKSQDPAQTIRDIIDYFNSIYSASFFSYDGSSIVDFGTSVSIDFDFDNCFQSMKKCQENTDFWFYIDQFGKVFFQEKPPTPTHKLTVGKDVEQINLSEDIEDLVNYVVVEYDGGTVISEDNVSQTEYGLKEKYINKSSDLSTSTAAQEYADNYVLENKDPKSKTTIVLNNNFDLESVNPGDTIKVLNFKYEINNLQVQKIIYKSDRATLFLDDFDSFAKELAKIV